MQTNYFEKWQSFGNDALEAAKELESINTNAFRKLTEQQLAALNLFVEAGVRQLNLFGQSKGYNDVLAGQAQIASETANKAVENARETFGIYSSVRDEFFAWAEKRGKTAASYQPEELSPSPRKAA